MATTTVTLLNDDGSRSSVNLPKDLSDKLESLPRYLAANSLNDRGEKVDHLSASSSWDVGVVASPSGKQLSRPPAENRNELRKQRIQNDANVIVRVQDHLKHLQADHEHLWDALEYMQHRFLLRLREEVLDSEKKLSRMNKRLLTLERKREGSKGKMVRLQWEANRFETEVNKSKVLGLFETLQRLLQFLNDRIFDVDHIIPNNGPATLLSREEKKRLKKNGMNFITHLLRETEHNPSNHLVAKALTCLTPNDILLAKFLQDELNNLSMDRNRLQGSSPNVTEAQELLSTIDISSPHDPSVRDLALAYLSQSTPPRRLPLAGTTNPIPLFTGNLELDVIRTQHQHAVQAVEEQQFEYSEYESEINELVTEIDETMQKLEKQRECTEQLWQRQVRREEVAKVRRRGNV